MDKGRITMAITLGLICFFLVVIMFIQFNTINQTDITSIKNMRETELKAEMTKWKTRLEETEKKYNDVITKKDEYNANIEDNEKTIKLLEEDLQEAQILLGMTDVTGNGIIVTLEDNEKKSITSDDLLELVNELRLAGAEAISINNERLVINSFTADIDYSFIVVNGQRISSPYIVKAIGNQSYLESGLIAKQYGYIDNRTKVLGKTVKLERKDNITIKKYEGKIILQNINKENERN